MLSTFRILIKSLQYYYDELWFVFVHGVHVTAQCIPFSPIIVLNELQMLNNINQFSILSTAGLCKDQSNQATVKETKPGGYCDKKTLVLR